MVETIRISEDLAETLRERKGPDEDYEDVIRRVLEASESDAVDGEDATTDDDRSDGVAGRPDPAIETDDAVARLVTEVAAEDLPDTDATVEQRREALLAVVEYLREHETAVRSDFERDVYPKHPAGYADRQEPERAWWEEAMSDGLAAIADRSDAIERGDSGEWRYAGGSGR